MFESWKIGKSSYNHFKADLVDCKGEFKLLLRWFQRILHHIIAIKSTLGNIIMFINFKCCVKFKYEHCDNYDVIVWSIYCVLKLWFLLFFLFISCSYIMIYWSISFIDINLLCETTYSWGLGISKGVMSDIPSHVVFHPSINVEEPSLIFYAFYSCCIVSTIVFILFYLFSQFVVVLFLLNFHSWNICFFVILLLVATFTSITFIIVVIILTLTIGFPFVFDAFLPWNIFCILQILDSLPSCVHSNHI